MRWIKPGAFYPKRACGSVIDSTLRRLGRELLARRRARNLQFFFGHVRRYVGEQRRAEITLAGVGQHAEDVRAFGRVGGDLQRAGERARPR